jgi:ABC-type spermidine/putrescine transport system permease subunit II
MNSKTMKRFINSLVNGLVLIFMAFITITPIYWCFVTSLKNANEIASYPPKVIGFNVTWANYQRILSAGYFQSVLNSALYTFAAIVLGLLSCSIWIFPTPLFLKKILVLHCGGGHSAVYRQFGIVDSQLSADDEAGAGQSLVYHAADLYGL